MIVPQFSGAIPYSSYHGNMKLQHCGVAPR